MLESNAPAGVGKRIGVPKSIRFDVFKRDSFTCRYCGSKPPDVFLEVDHLVPVSKGGKNDGANLVTSCFNCNRGKSDKTLSDPHEFIDADLEVMRLRQETAEYQAYLVWSKIREDEMNNVIEVIQQRWTECFEMEDCPSGSVIKSWLGKFSPQDIEIGIEASVPAALRGQINRWNFSKMLRYVYAVIRNISEGRNHG